MSLKAIEYQAHGIQLQRCSLGFGRVLGTLPAVKNSVDG
jgi:hypothetical protein